MKRMPLSRSQQKRVEALGDQQFDQVGIGAVLRHPRHVVEELVGRVGAEVGFGDLLLGEVGHQRLDVVDAVVDDAHRARGVAAVAARLVLGRALPASATLAPCSCAASAAQNAALPPPTTITSNASAIPDSPRCPTLFPRHGRACPGHPRLFFAPPQQSKTWMPGTRPGMTKLQSCRFTTPPPPPRRRRGPSTSRTGRA